MNNNLRRFNLLDYWVDAPYEHCSHTLSFGNIFSSSIAFQTEGKSHAERVYQKMIYRSKSERGSKIILTKFKSMLHRRSRKYCLCNNNLFLLLMANPLLEQLQAKALHGLLKFWCMKMILSFLSRSIRFFQKLLRLLCGSFEFHTGKFLSNSLWTVQHIQASWKYAENVSCFAISPREFSKHCNTIWAREHFPLFYLPI